MEVRLLDDDEVSEYDKLVDDSIEGTIFHKSWWLNIFKTYYGNSYEIKLYGAFKNDALIAAMPIPVFHRYGSKFIYPPKFTPYLGSFFIVSKEEKIYKKISKEKEINEKFAIALKKHGHCLYYPFSHGNVDLQPFKWNGFDIGVHYTYVLKLHDLNKILSNMSKKRRWCIRKRSKEGYKIRMGEIKTHIELTNKTMMRQKQPLVDEKILLAIFQEGKKHNSCEVFTLYDETDIPTASLLLTWDNKRSYYLGAGISENASQGDMPLLIFEAMRYTKEKLNLLEYDFEGSDVKSIEYFFRSFGGNLVPLYFIYHNSIRRWILMKLYQFYKKWSKRSQRIKNNWW